MATLLYASTATLAVPLLLSACALVATARPSDTSPEPAAEVPLWRRYFRNDSLTGRVVACSEEEKFCLQRGLLLDEESGNCFLWGKNYPCKALSDVFRVDKGVFRETGHVKGACVNRNLCDDESEYKMAADGSCRYMAEVAEICYNQTGVSTSEDLFGETDCACNIGPCPVPDIPMASPPKVLAEGQCVVPDLRNTALASHSWDSMLVTARSEVPCTETERRCFLDGRVHHELTDLCYDLWQQGPCEGGQWFAIDREEAQNGSGKVRGKCEALPCGSERVRSAVDGSCVTPRELCGGAFPIRFNGAGDAACAFSLKAASDDLRLPTHRIADGLCQNPVPETWPGPVGHGLPPIEPPRACPESKTGYCDRDVEKSVADQAGN